MLSNLDFRPGVMFLYVMETPGSDMYGKFVYREIVPQERIVLVVSFADAEGNTTRAPFSPTWPLEMISVVNFAEEDGKTRLTMDGRPWNASDEEKADFASNAGSVENGTNGTLDNLTNHLATITL